jgi:hypothetical protein
MDIPPTSTMWNACHIVPLFACQELLCVGKNHFFGVRRQNQSRQCPARFSDSLGPAPVLNANVRFLPRPETSVRYIVSEVNGNPRGSLLQIFLLG